MKKFIFLLVLIAIGFTVKAQSQLLSDTLVHQLAAMPLHCINQEYPNKTGHTFNSADEVGLSPKDLHPVFYGCFDWHSSVHGHWMLVRLLNHFKDFSNRDAVIQVLENSFQADKITQEANYFSDYKLAKHFERTYGWAWVLKLDEELTKSQLPEAKKWHKNLQVLTDVIVECWMSYLPKQTYPNRTGVHPNSAFALGFAIDWARTVNNKDFEKALILKAVEFYADDVNTPAYLEPNGSDFFSPSLQIAYLMSRVYPQDEFEVWFGKFLDKRGLNRISEIPVISDLEDYQTVHLVGLSFSRAWCMKGIAKKLSRNYPLTPKLYNTADKLIENALPLVFQGNYGGGHWLGSFAVYSLIR